MVSSSTNGAVWAERIQSATATKQGWSFNKKVLLFVFVFVQVAVFGVIQWRFNGVFNVMGWSSPSVRPPRVSDIRNFLGEREAREQKTVISAHVHRQHPVLGHTYEDDDDVSPIIDPRDIAIGLGITSRKLHPRKPLPTWPFFTQLLTSFCQTASDGFRYHFFLAYDIDDAFFTSAKLERDFAEKFREYTQRHCTGRSEYHMHFIHCSHAGKPANAQNDAMMAAYMLNMAYFYRVNDDSVMKTPRWTELFIKALARYDPPNIGVVGPNHRGGNTAILTYDFVSYHHVNIFGFYYPHVFTDWFGDSWMSLVYQPGRVAKVSGASA
jgi:hypothetical protein